MSQRPIARSPDLSKLRNEGFDIRMIGGYLVVRDVPYLRAKNEIARGMLACAISAADDLCGPPADHTAFFVGDHPCNTDGTPMIQVVLAPNAVVISDTITTTYYLSAKPKPRDRYVDFHEKVTTYVRRLSGPAEEVDPTVTAKTFPFIPTEDDDSVFHYTDLATSRSDTGEVSRKLRLGKIGILGLGGTGGYILDLVAKTPVAEIHLFDGDVFSQHNAFRAPGAASGADLQQRLMKVDYLHGIYSKMHKRIVAHREFLSDANLDQLTGMDFVFLSMEAGPVKARVIEKLLAQGTAMSREPATSPLGLI